MRAWAVVAVACAAAARPGVVVSGLRGGGQPAQERALWLLNSGPTAPAAEVGASLQALAADADADALSVAMGSWAAAQRSDVAEAGPYLDAAAAVLEDPKRCAELAALPRAAEALTNTARAFAVAAAQKPRPALFRALAGAAPAAYEAFAHEPGQFALFSRCLGAAKAQGGYRDRLLPFGEDAPAALAALAHDAVRRWEDKLVAGGSNDGNNDRGGGDLPVALLDDFVTEEDARELLDLAKNLWAPSKTDGAGAGYRTSETASLRSPEARGAPVVQRLSAAAAAVFGLGPEHCETLQLVRYTDPGHYYKAHCDLIEDDDQLLAGGQRLATLLLYLTAPEAGGETEFVELGLKVRPLERAALAWPNVAPDGRPLPLSRHAALPIAPGAATPKIAVNCWIRAFPGAADL